MGKFEEKKKELKEQVMQREKETGQKRTTFSAAAFDSLATALFNDPEFQEKTMVTKDAEQIEEVSTPVADLRKVMIGSVLRSAGVDSAEASKIIEKHEFPNLPMYGYTAALLEGYLDSGKSFTFPKKSDLECTLVMENVPEAVKESTNALQKKEGEETKTYTTLYGEYRRIKAKSTCPQSRRTRLD